MNTGDLGFLLDGELYVIGRSKDLIIIRGRNIYPQDIERAVERALPFVEANSCTAFSLMDGGEEKLGLLIEANREFVRTAKASTTDPAATATLREHVARVRQEVGDEFEIPVYALAFVRPGEFPRTSSGKVQRHRCREMLRSGEQEFVFAVNVADAASVGSDAGSIRHEASDVSSNPQRQRGRTLPETPSTERREAPALADAVGYMVDSRRESAAKADAIIVWLRDYAARRINSRVMDERRMVAPSVVLDFGNHGLFGLQVPKQYGGLDLTTTDMLRVMEQLAAIDLTLAAMVGIHNGLGVRPILNFGSESLRQELLPLLATGRQLAAFALTEPGAGSNPNALQATAHSTADGWRVNAEKQWIGLASWAGVITVFAKALDTNGTSVGTVALAVREDTSGLRHGAESLTMGMRGIVQNTVLLENAALSAESLLGRVGDGMKVAQDAMMFCRLGLAAMSVGGMKRCAQLMTRYAERRTIASGPLLDNPVSLARIQELTCAISATEALVGQAAAWLDAGEEVPVEAYIACKTSGPELLGHAVDQAMQLLGGRGYVETNVLPQMLRDARLLRIFSGPTETLNAYLGANVLQRPDGIRRLFEKFSACANDISRNALASGSSGSTGSEPDASAFWLMGQPDIASELFAAAKQLEQQVTHGSAASHRQWIAFQIGELATAAILWAAVTNRHRDNIEHAAVSWARDRFHRLRDVALAPTGRDAAALLAQPIADRVSDYAASIGDIEQALPGEDDELDAYLRQSGTTLRVVNRDAERRATMAEADAASVSLGEPGAVRPRIPLATNIVRGLTPSGSPDSGLRQLLHDTIVEWLRENVDANIAGIDDDASFMALGIDSVGAAEIALQIEKAIGVSLTPDALYDHRTLRELTAHLGQKSVPRPSGSGHVARQSGPLSLTVAVRITSRSGLVSRRASGPEVHLAFPSPTSGGRIETHFGCGTHPPRASFHSLKCFAFSFESDGVFDPSVAAG